MFMAVFPEPRKRADIQLSLNNYLLRKKTRKTVKKERKKEMREKRK